MPKPKTVQLSGLRIALPSVLRMRNGVDVFPTFRGFNTIFSILTEIQLLIRLQVAVHFITQKTGKKAIARVVFAVLHILQHGSGALR